MSATFAADAEPFGTLETTTPNFRDKISSYIGVPADDIPNDPIACLQSFLTILPSSLLTETFSWLSPKRRSAVPGIRNRRFAYTKTSPPQFTFSEAKAIYPSLWRGTERPGTGEGENERRWVQDKFMNGNNVMRVGKLSNLLGDYEEERQAERIRSIRRERAAAEEFIPEEDTDSEDEDEEPEELTRASTSNQDDQFEETELDFERKIKEMFIYGFLPDANYDQIDWDDSWDDNRESEEAWFMDDD